MPSGCPIAIAPPLTFTRSSSRPSSRMTARLCDAKASFSSTRSSSLDRHPGAAEQLAHGRNRPDAHHRRVDPGGRRAGEHPERLDPECPGALLAGDHERRGTVVDPARVACRDRPVRTERRPQRGKLLERRLGSRMLVLLEVRRRHELVGEAAGLLRLRPTPLRAQGERVLFLTGHVPPLCDVLPRLAHRGPRVLSS